MQDKESAEHTVLIFQIGMADKKECRKQAVAPFGAEFQSPRQTHLICEGLVQSGMEALKAVCPFCGKRGFP